MREENRWFDRRTTWENRPSFSDLKQKVRIPFTENLLVADEFVMRRQRPQIKGAGCLVEASFLPSAIRDPCE